MTKPTASNDTPRREPQRKTRRRPEPRFRKVVRVMAYFATVCGVGGLLAASSAYGNVKDGALEIGEELGKLDHIGTKTPIELNGQPIYVGSQVLDMSVSEALDRAETLCRASGNPAAPGKAADPLLLDSDELALETGGGEAIGEVRQERDGRGVVLCFAPIEGRPPIDGIADKLDRYLTFFRSGNFDDLGRLRYFFAKPTDAGRTHLVRVWTDAPFNLYAMTSTEGGDAPGTDPSDVPRPPESRRLLSATAAKTVYATRVYETTLTPTQIAETYDERMPDRGWKQMVRDGHTRVYKRRDVSVFITPSERDGRTLVSMLHMGYDPTVAASDH